MEDIAANLQQYKSQLSDQCRLIAVSKTKPAEMILEAYRYGHRDFGENKVQELAEKHDKLPKDIRWHMIGHLQRNKVKYIAPFVALIHAVDSERLLREIDKQAGKNNRIIDCLMQIHVAAEETKFGWLPEELIQFVKTDALDQYPNIRITGLMGMATNTENTQQVSKEFAEIKAVFELLKQYESDRLQMTELSMGMTSDYKVAVEEGSTMVRIGTAIFGKRIKNEDKP